MDFERVITPWVCAVVGVIVGVHDGAGIYVRVTVHVLVLIMEGIIVLVETGTSVNVLVADAVTGSAVPVAVRVYDGALTVGMGVSVTIYTGAPGVIFFEQPAAMKIKIALRTTPAYGIFFTFTSMQWFFLLLPNLS
jgi:hypothetical protein